MKNNARPTTGCVGNFTCDFQGANTNAIIPSRQGVEVRRFFVSDECGVSAHYPRLVMDNTATRWTFRRLVHLAYHPHGRKTPRWWPGPAYDLTVVGLFLFLAVAYAVT